MMIKHKTQGCSTKVFSRGAVVWNTPKSLITHGVDGDAGETPGDVFALIKLQDEQTNVGETQDDVLYVVLRAGSVFADLLDL